MKQRLHVHSLPVQRATAALVDRERGVDQILVVVHEPLGAIRVTAKLPASNNVNQFTTAIGANPADRWTNVNERALSETNGWLDAVDAHAENYGIEAASAGDVNISGATLIARMAWVWAKATTGGLGSPKITNNGTDTAVVLASTSKLFTNIVDSGSYPANAAAVGMVSAGVTDTTSLFEAGMLVAYIPAAASDDELAEGRRLMSIP